MRGGVAAGIAFALAATRLPACECVKPGDGADVVATYDAVFVGEPIDVAIDESFPDSATRAISGRWIRFRVSQSWRGADDPFVWVHTGPLPGGCGFDFALQRRYVVFATKANGRFETGICDPTAAVEEAGSTLDRLGIPAKIHEPIADPERRP